MPYNNNVPQPNQTISSTTTPINNNFKFIQTDAQVEHSFNGNSAGAEGTHLLASMPNRALNPAVPSGCNGVYYSNSSQAHFYNGTNDYQLSVWTNVITGNVGPITGSYQPFFTLPANIFGVLYFYNRNPGNTAFTATSANIATDGNRIYGYVNLTDTGGSATPIKIMDPNPGLIINLRTDASRYSGATYQYLLLYRPA